MSLGSSESGNGQTTSYSGGSATQQQGSTGPWAPAAGSAIQAVSNAGSLYANGQLNPTGQYATTNQNLINLGMGSPGLTTSNNVLSGIASGNTNSAGTAALTGLANGTSSNQNLNSMYGQEAGQIQSQLGGEFNSAGRLGSGAQAFNTGQALNNAGTDLYGTAYAQNQANQLSAAQSLGSQQISAAAGLGSNYNLGLTGASAANTAAQATTPMAALQNYNSLIYPYTGIGSTSTSSGNEQDAGSSQTMQMQSNSALIGQYLQMIGMAAGGASDRKLKSKIKRLGTHKLGFGIYSYIKDNLPEVGFIAQEVKKIMPDAVMEHPLGYLMVNYSLIASRAI